MPIERVNVSLRRHGRHAVRPADHRRAARRRRWARPSSGAVDDIREQLIDARRRAARGCRVRHRGRRRRRPGARRAVACAQRLGGGAAHAQPATSSGKGTFQAQGGLDPETGQGMRLGPLAPGGRCGGGGGGPRDRPRPIAPLRGRGLLGSHDQRGPGRAADRGQRRVRSRPGAVRGDALRQRPAAERQPRRLHDRQHRGHARAARHHGPREPRARRDPRHRRDRACRRSCRRSATPSTARLASASAICPSPPRRCCAASAKPNRNASR